MGPYTLRSGEKLEIENRIYQIELISDTRLTFTDVSTKTVYGPYKYVDGRIMRIGGTAYVFKTVQPKEQGTAPAARTTHTTRQAESRRAELDVEFVPQPPKPVRLEEPEDKRRVVKPLDIKPLPDTTRPWAISASVVPFSEMPVEWNANSAQALDTDIERKKIGFGASRNSWSLLFDILTDGEGGTPIADGVSIANCKVSDGSGYSLTFGYKRPFMVQGSWKASAGIFARYSTEDFDLSYTAFGTSGASDTNTLGNVKFDFQEKYSSIELTEKTIFIDLELAYIYRDATFFAACLIQPYSDLEVKGTMTYGNAQTIKLSADHDDPIAVRLGARFDLINNYRIITDLTFGFEDQFRLGVVKEF